MNDPTTAAPRIAPRTLPLPPELAERMARLLPPGVAPPQIFLTVARHGELFMEMVDSGFLGPTGLAVHPRSVLRYQVAALTAAFPVYRG